MDDFTYTLDRLAHTFTVKDIMVRTDKLSTAPDVEAAWRSLQENNSFDVIPIQRDGELKAYLERGKSKEKYIDLRELSSDATSILELVNIFTTRRFIFILSGQRVAGYIHYSDLNNQMVKLPFYVLFESVERQIILKISGMITESLIQSIFKSEKSIEIFNRMENQRAQNVDLGWASVLYFGEILQTAQYLGVIQISEEDIKLLNRFRNRIAHSEKLLIQKYEDVLNLSKIRTLCELILSMLE